MRLAIISHKLCWKSDESPLGYATDGGFPLQVDAISQLFDATEIVVPVSDEERTDGLSPLLGHGTSIRALSVPSGRGIARKLSFPIWLLRNSPAMWKAVKHADAVHAPIPGDIGTIGLLFALIQRKPLFVRHCGNWGVQRTAAERFWRWIMEAFAGGRNVMLATGGSSVPPSDKNRNIKWVFSTSLRESDLRAGRPRELPEDGAIRLIIACRQEVGKGTDVVIRSLPKIASIFPGVRLEVVGGGSQLRQYEAIVQEHGLGSRVTFHGHVKQERVIELLRQAHLFCFPTTASEGFPKAVLEALACGLPVVTTRVSVLPVLIGSGCGRLIAEATPDSLAEAVIQICSDRDEHRAMSQRALETACAYSLESWRDFIGKTLSDAWNVSSLSST